ncbi:MAG: 30S ribosomal protein S6 [Bryobacteraceae bacterium]
MNRIYEELFIIRPDASEEEITPIIEQIKSVITNAGGTIDKEELWGIRKLAYRVQKRNEGYYVLLQFTADAQVVKEVERRLRVQDAVMKFQTVRIDEKLKWLEKRKKARDKRAARRPAPVAPAPLAPEPMMPATPGSPMPGAPAAADAGTPEAPEMTPVATPASSTSTNTGRTVAVPEEADHG